VGGLRRLVWNAFGGRFRALACNLFPAYRGTGGRVSFVAADLREIRVRLPLDWRTRNYVGSIFGGSLYGAVDPFYMIMLIELLGPEYVVWDRAATIRFLKPGRSTLFATFHVPEAETQEIRRLLERSPSVDRVYMIELADAAGTVHAVVEKTVYIRRRTSPDIRPGA
jgi:acyl-coenzyme A thioesterase PaaI-like protein